MGDFVYARRENRLAIEAAEAVDSNVNCVVGDSYEEKEERRRRRKKGREKHFVEVETSGKWGGAADGRHHRCCNLASCHGAHNRTPLRLIEALSISAAALPIVGIDYVPCLKSPCYLLL
jgi:hypothetical protein